MTDHTETEPPIVKIPELELPKPRPVVPDNPEVIDDDQAVIENIVDSHIIHSKKM